MLSGFESLPPSHSTFAEILSVFASSARNAFLSASWRARYHRCYMPVRTALVGGFCLSIVVGCAFLSAQRSPSAASRFTQLDCTFSSSVSATWNTAGARAQVRKGPVLEFRIEHIDAGGGSADLTLGALTVGALMTANAGLLHFIEPPTNGETAITSVDTTSRARRFPASYSRTMFYAYSGPGFTSAPLAEQYYGYCVPPAPR